MSDFEKPSKKERKAAKINAMIEKIDAIIDDALALEMKYKKTLDKVHPDYLLSAQNLIHYRALRSHKLSELQKGLGNLGLSRLARIQSHVLRSLYTVRANLKCLRGKELKYIRSGVSAKKGSRFLKKNAKSLLGYRSKGRRTRIMVTLPSEAADHYEMVSDMMAAGMNCARINCAHDDWEVWQKMINHVHKASEKLKKKCKVAMDLAGPKIRTGELVKGPRVRKFKPEKDIRGKVIQALKVLISCSDQEYDNIPKVPVNQEDFNKLTPGDVLHFKDARNKKRKLFLVESHPNGIIALCPKTTFLETGTQLFLNKNGEQESLSIAALPMVEVPIVVHIGDTIHITKKAIPGEAAQVDESGKVMSPAHVSCTAPEVFNDLKAGESIFFDDGKIGGKIKSVNEDFIEVKITNADEKGSKLRSDKGINFPSSNLTISGLTPKDRIDVEFVAQQADVINLSFVNSPKDVKDLLVALNNIETEKKCGIILKIETQRGFFNLIETLLQAMQVYPVGVMIARGDLAVESGWKNIGRVQQEILSICQAAHVTDIWATQVLDNLAKKGIPSRAEMTDVVKAQQADCIMLNKGPHIFDSIHLLHNILVDLEPYREKNVSFSPPLPKGDFPL